MLERYWPFETERQDCSDFEIKKGQGRSWCPEAIHWERQAGAACDLELLQWPAGG